MGRQRFCLFWQYHYSTNYLTSIGKFLNFIGNFSEGVEILLFTNFKMRSVGRGDWQRWWEKGINRRWLDIGYQTGGLFGEKGESFRLRGRWSITWKSPPFWIWAKKKRWRMGRLRFGLFWQYYYNTVFCPKVSQSVPNCPKFKNAFNKVDGWINVIWTVQYIHVQNVGNENSQNTTWVIGAITEKIIEAKADSACLYLSSA